MAIELEALDELMAAEVDELAGPRASMIPPPLLPTWVRGRIGHTRGPQGRGRHPLAGIADDAGEASLASYETAMATNLLGERMVGAMLAGLSTRRYPAALEPVGDETDERGQATSKPSVSRAFVAATAERLEQLSRRCCPTKPGAMEEVPNYDGEELRRAA